MFFIWRLAGHVCLSVRPSVCVCVLTNVSEVITVGHRLIILLAEIHWRTLITNQKMDHPGLFQASWASLPMVGLFSCCFPLQFVRYCQQCDRRMALCGVRFTCWVYVHGATRDDVMRCDVAYSATDNAASDDVFLLHCQRPNQVDRLSVMWLCCRRAGTGRADRRTVILTDVGQTVSTCG